MTAAELDFLCVAAADGRPVVDLEAAAAKVGDWGEIQAAASRHDLVPQLHRAIGRLGERVPPPVRDQVRADYAARALHAMQLARELERLIERCAAAGIPVIPWKGPALAEELYGDPALRTCVDLDMLVPGEQVPKVLALLLEDGYRLDFDIPESRWPALRRAINHLHLSHPTRNLIVEPHWALFHPMYVLPFDLADQWRAPQVNSVSRHGCLAPGDLLLLLCAHGTKHRWRKLRWVVDIERLIRKHPELDLPRLLLRAERMGLRRILLLGLALAGELCALDLDETVRARLAEDPAVPLLVAEVVGRLRQNRNEDRDLFGEYRFLLRSRERLKDRLLLRLRLIFSPRLSDWQLFPLGSHCYPLFYLERPLRMIWKWLLRPLFIPASTRSSN